MTGATTESNNTIELRLEARAENLALTRLALAGVAANAGASREVVSDLKLAVTEACTNVIKHAYGEEPSAGEIVVRYAVAPGMFSIEVEDTGSGFDPGASPANVDRNGDGGNGMGLMIIRMLTDELSVTSSGSGTRLSFVKRFSPES